MMPGVVTDGAQNWYSEPASLSSSDSANPPSSSDSLPPSDSSDGAKSSCWTSTSCSSSSSACSLSSSSVRFIYLLLFVPGEPRLVQRVATSGSMAQMISRRGIRRGFILSPLPPLDVYFSLIPGIRINSAIGSLALVQLYKHANTDAIHRSLLVHSFFFQCSSQCTYTAVISASPSYEPYSNYTQGCCHYTLHRKTETE